MASYNRKEMILEFMRSENRFVTVEQLCSRLYVSGATIRRDLTDLEHSRLIRRTRGGALLVEGSANEDPLAFRENQNAVQKQIIANMACDYIRDGMTLFVDSSTTAFTLARNFDRFSNLRVITNGLKTSLLLSDYKNVSVMCTGGTLREDSKSLTGVAAIEFIDRLNADIAFMSCRGFSFENGASEASEGEYYIKQHYIRNSKACILLLDTSKIGQDYICRMGGLHIFDHIITENVTINQKCRELISAARLDI
jgi:Transcriptional regulators of sugar metabolism